MVSQNNHGYIVTALLKGVNKRGDLLEKMELALPPISWLKILEFSPRLLIYEF